MKFGKYVELNEYENVKLNYGTVDQKNLKTIFLTLNSWLEPIEYDNHDKIIYNSRRKIKERIRNEKNEYFKKESIVDIDIKTKGIKRGKRSFMDIQITLFTEKDFLIKMPEIKKYLQNLLENIIKNDLNDKNFYNFHKIKK